MRDGAIDAEDIAGLGEAPFRMLAEHLPALCFMADAAGRMLWCNKRWYDYTGVERGADLDAAFAEAHAEAGRGEVQRRWEQALVTGEAGEMVTPFRRADGRVLPFLTRAEPMRDAAGAITLWLGVMTEISSQQEAERHQRVLVELGDVLRDESDPLTILQTTGRVLAAHLEVSRVGYGEVSEDGEMVQGGGRGWQAPGMPGTQGVFPLDGFGAAAADAVRRGETVVIADIFTDPRVGAGAAAHKAVGARAAVSVPLIRRGRLESLIYVHSPKPRPWRDAEVQLIEEVAERTWATLERAKAEAAKRESEARLRLALEGAHLGTIQWDLRTRRGRWSRRATEIYGAEPGEEITVERLRATIHPEDRDYVFGEIETAIRGRDQYAAEYRIVRPDGGLRWVVSRARVERDGDGEATGTVGFVMDVTARKLAEERLRDSEARQRAIVDTTPECVKIVGCDGRLVYMNPAGLEMIEAGAEGVSGLDVAAMVAPEHRARWRAMHRRVCAGESVSWEFDVIGLRGARRRMETHAVPLAALDGTLQQLAVTRDVTERKGAEARLRESEERFRGVIETAHEGVWIVNREGETLFANDRMANLLGCTAEAMAGRPVPEFCFPEDMAAARERIGANLAGSPEQFEFRFRRADGSALPVLAATNALYDGAGSIIGAVGMFSDLTERKQAEAELQRSRDALHQSEKLTALGSLLAGVSHELNNPLSVVLTLSQLLESKAEGTPYGERAGKIHAAAQRCARIVQTFLAMARQKAPERTRVEAENVVRSALELTGYGLRTGGVELVLDLAPGLPPLNADADQLGQVLVNLIVNAQHALQERAAPRRLTLRARAGERSRTVRIEVADNGPGVPPENRRRIFEPFFTSKPQGVGTGIGLSFSLGVVEAHGGTLRYSESVGGGACFTVELPVAAGAVAPGQVGAAPVFAATPLGRALIVDDETDLADALAEMVGGEHYRVDVARSGREARALLGHGTYDVILSDLRMPDMDGPALFDWLELERPELVARTAFVTGDTLGPAAARFLSCAGRPVLEKPFDTASLRRVLAELRAPAEAADA